MAIEMFCDHCEDLIPENINGGVRLKMGKKEYIFHLCGKCQELLRSQIKDEFLEESEWRVVG